MLSPTLFSVSLPLHLHHHQERERERERSVKSAKGMLVNITGGSDLTLFEVDKAAQRVSREVEDESANVIFGSSLDSSLQGSIRVSIVATGIDSPSHSSSSSLSSSHSPSTT
mmetsp:Transcript_23279/g.23490  ORF Transcript_23279/g.23490 Transcript_23279/m.23490 type:complete len:112 (+) Transcript_23279:1074-1409(+)